MTAPWRSEADRQDHRDRVRRVFGVVKDVKCEPCLTKPEHGGADCIRPCVCRDSHRREDEA